MVRWEEEEYANVKSKLVDYDAALSLLLSIHYAYYPGGLLLGYCWGHIHYSPIVLDHRSYHTNST
jgi:hypothetical protein